MVPVLAAAIAIWLVGALLRVPRRLRWALIALLYAAVLGAQVLLPPDAPLRLATGGRAEPWLALGLAAAVLLAYRAVLARLGARAAAAPHPPGRGGGGRPPPPPPPPPRPPPPPPPPPPFRPAELERYARHIVLREIGGTGQKRLKSARVLVIGAGGLGSPALLYLAAAGVGTLGVIDDDAVEGSNLQRQIIHTDDRIGMPKVHSAATAVAALNPFVTLRPYHRRLTDALAPTLFADYDLILDGSDNFETRHRVNRAAVATGTPLIAAAIAQWEGQIGLYHPAAGGPCLACVFPVVPAAGLAPACAEAGVIAPLPGVLGAMMALEAVKHLTGAGTGLAGRLLLYDGLHAEVRTIAVRRDPACPVCGPRPGAPDAPAAPSSS
jgi:molybdopterin/thiamine biosynthesis adenylyltransferase